MNATVIRQLCTTRGVISLKIPSYIGTDNLISDSIKYAKEMKFAVDGDSVVCILAQSEETPDYSNILKITTI